MIRLFILLSLILVTVLVIVFFWQHKGQDFFYKPSYEDFSNPERGFYTAVNLFEPASLDRAAEKGFSLGHAFVLLTQFRDKPISNEFLADLEVGLEHIQSSGLKIILRFAYSDTLDAEDAGLETVMQHMQQLKPLLEKYKAVIAVQQVGFIGAWGEWHNSSNKLLESKNEIIEKLLSVLPPDRMIALRNPRDLQDIYPKALTKEQAFDASFQARTGFHNDCLLSNKHDSGTYFPADKYEDLRNYSKSLTKFTAAGGETCASTPEEQRTDCPTSLKELKALHWDYLNKDYYPEAIERWRNEGCLDKISRHLGYRFEIIKLNTISKLKQGKVFFVKLKLKNSGFGKVYNPRNIELILMNTESNSQATFKPNDAKDSRLILPLAGETSTIKFRINSSKLKPGSYKAFLNLSDPLLPDNPAYSIRLANENIWQESSGFNDLGVTIEVEASK